MSHPESKLHSPRLLTVFFSLLQVLKAGLSLVLVWVSANIFGAGVDREAWVIGWGAQMWLFKLLFTPVNESFRARFLQLREQEGEPEALGSFAGLVLVLSVATIVLLVLLFFCSESFMQFIAPGYRGQEGADSIRLMTLYLLPLLLLSEWTYLFTALLHCYRSFYLPELFSLFTIVLNLLLLWFFGNSLGIYAFALANYLSLLVLLFLLIYQCGRLGLLRFRFSRAAAIRRFFGYAAPLYAAAMAMQFNVWSERRMLSFLPLGSNAAIDYARKFVDAPVIFVAALSTAIIAPLLANVAGKEGGAAFRRECFLFLRTCLLVLTPAIMLCVCNAGELVQAFLLHGSFDAVWEPDLVASLRWFGIGLPGTVVCMIVGQIMIVKQRVNAYALVTVAAQLLPVLVNYIYFRTWGISVFAGSWALCQLLASLVLLVLADLWQGSAMRQLLGMMLVCALSVACAEGVLALLPIQEPGTRLLFLLVLNPLFLLLAMLLFQMEEVVILKRLTGRYKSS
jgi:peptidoglycan biosynthesis protein MviN/MurJ (putative lipid II flippase)